MANVNLTDSIITKAALAILHEKIQFIGSTNRAYDDSFAKKGAKIGSTLRIRKPVQYKTRLGKALSVQDSVEEELNLVVSTQRGVDIEFDSAELALDIDEFSSRYLEPAMAILASDIEADYLDIIKNVGNAVYNATGLVWKDTVLAKAKLDNQLAPMDNNRMILIEPFMQVDVLDDTKGLFQDSTQISRQYREGYIGVTGGFTWTQSSRLPNYENGDTVTGLTLSTAIIEGASQIVLAGTTNGDTFKKGQIFTIAGLKAIHQETKKSYSYDRQFAITADVTATGATVTLPVLQAIFGSTSDPRQNISGLGSGAEVVTVIGGADASLPQSIAYHKDAFTFATADLPLPKGTDMAARENFEGVAMRLIKDYDINSDSMPCRFDVLYGFTTLREEYAVRLISGT